MPAGREWTTTALPVMTLAIVLLSEVEPYLCTTPVSLHLSITIIEVIALLVQILMDLNERQRIQLKLWFL